MRVICEKCRSAYAIDDAQVAPSGSRTQCPRCSHVQLAKPIAKKKGGSGPVKTIALSEAEHDARATAAALRDGSAAWSEIAALTGGGAPGQSAAGATSRGGPVPGAGAGARGGPPGEPGAAGAGAGLADRCRTCGVALTDPFDQALGTCDACREKEAAAAQGPRGNGARATSPGARAAGPAKSALLPNLFEDHEQPAPAATVSLTDLHTPKKKIAPLTQQTVVLTARRSGTPGWLWGLLVLALIGGGGGGYYWWMQQPNQGPHSEPPRTGPEAEVIARFRARYGVPKETSAALVVKGRDKLVEDRGPAYAKARELFTQALIISPRDPDAAFGFAEAVAQGFPDDAGALRDAKAVLAAQPQTPRVKIARADLIRVSGGPDANDSALALAQSALSSVNGEDAAWAHLSIGRSYLAHAAEAAVAAFTQALKESGRLVAAYTLRGEARAQLGDFKGALADLQQRLAIDPDHWPTLSELGRLELSIGQVNRARLLYQRAHEAAPSRLEPVIALAKVHYQLEGKSAEAIALLSSALRAHPGLEAAPSARLQAQLAAAYRTAGDLGRAATAANAALGLLPDDGPAHLQLLLIDLARGRAQDAQGHLAKVIAAKGIDRALADLLTGRVDFALGKLDDAVAAFQKAAAEDPRRTDALLWAGAALAAQKQKDAAEPLLMHALEADPTRTAPAQLLSDYWIKPGELLAGAEGKVAELARSGNDPMPKVFEAAIRFHQKDLGQADRYLREALAVDDANVLALALRALVLVDQGRPAEARQAAERSTSLARQVPLAHYAFGRALLAAGQTDRAKKELEQAHALAPSMAAPELALAQIEAKTAKDAARQRLEKLLSVDPSNGEVRRALYALEVQ